MISFYEFFIKYQLLSEGVSERKQRYLPMFNKVLEKDNTIKRNIDGLVDKSIRVLKKDNIVTWFLLQLRNRLIDELQMTDPFPTDHIVTYKQWLGNFEHFISLPIPKIQNFKYDRFSTIDVLREFKRYETEWKESRSQWIDITEELTEGAINKVIDFGEFAWFDLNRAYCELEGNAMGHCGNRGNPQDGDTVLSFRKVKKEGGRIWSRPSLTFILKAGYLGEMKGRANEKPNEKYHPYIIKLLTYQVNGEYIVKGIRGGGYLPESNFSTDDLEENDRMRLMELRPEFRPFEEKALTMSDEELIATVANTLEMNPDTIKIETTRFGKKFLIDQWPDWTSLFDDIPVPDNLEKYKDYITGDADIYEWMEPSHSEEEARWFLEMVMRDPVVSHRIMEAIGEETDVYENLNKYHPDVISLIYDSLGQGQYSGIHNQMMNRFRDGINNLEFSVTDFDCQFDAVFEDYDNWLNSPILARFNMVNMSDLISSGVNPFEDFQVYDGDMEIPYNGFDEYDEKAAIKHFSHELRL